MLENDMDLHFSYIFPEGAALHPASLLPDSAFAVQGIHGKNINISI